MLNCLWLPLVALVGAEAPPTNVSFSRDVRPILSEYCFTCHGPDDAGRQTELRFDVESSAKGDHDGTVAVVPGKPEASELIRRLESRDPDEQMPPPQLGKTVSPRQIAVLKAWIRDGAKWGNHWSYEPIVRPPVPKTDEPNPIDAFLAERLKREGLTFSPEADRATLVRRLALDVTGLPPTLEELQEFAWRFSSSPRLQVSPSAAKDLETRRHGDGEKAYEAVVDHFLASPAYGEHWARQWLDLARYADSAGYPSDPGREIWSYRDWVIRALNASMPFDQFTIEQLAGDLLEKPSDDQLVATAFHRNTMTQNEGGTNDEEFRNAAVIDRVNTTFAVWMGTTIACAQCHTHKYDPISNREYFQVYDFLNQTADADKKDEAPIHELISPELQRDRAAWTKQVARLEADLSKPTDERLEGIAAWLDDKPKVNDAKLKPAVEQSKDKRNAEQTKQLEQYYVRFVSPATKAARDELAAVQKKLADSKPPTVPIMQELATDKRRTTRIQLRGNWQALGDEVSAGVPSAFPSLPNDAPLNRLGFARWLVNRENPLTARVTVNRLWETVFGVGIVRSSEEFGSQGDPPTHPELLDWLAAEFMESGWDVKHLLRLMLTSRAYRQVAVVTPALHERDPDNRLLARGPRFRPSGELLRDQALAVAGLLSPKMYGPAVRPLRPSLGLNTAFGRGNDWETSPGEDRHRRSVYTEVRRNSPYPSFGTFDAPNREVCTIRRDRSNTPLQALVTLNDPVFVEAAQGLARRIVHDGGSNTVDRLHFAFRLCLAREPSAADLAALTRVHDLALDVYRGDAATAAKLATEPLGPAPKDADLPSLAAWTAVANVLLNLDEFLMRP